MEGTASDVTHGVCMLANSPAPSLPVLSVILNKAIYEGLRFDEPEGVDISTPTDGE